jgi:hypothetical protein
VPLTNLLTEEIQEQGVPTEPDVPHGMDTSSHPRLSLDAPVN